MKKKTQNMHIGLIIAAVVLINIVAIRFFLRLDFTQDNRYTLSKATKNILKNLEEPVTITAYFSEGLPPDIMKTRNDFKELLIEYKSVAKGNVEYEFIDPGKEQENEMKAQQAGVQPVIINVREKDQMKQQKAYLGAVIRFGEQTEVLPVIQPGAAMEYALSSAIKKVSVSEKPSIAYLKGHGEPALYELQQVKTSLSVLYDVAEVELSDTLDKLQAYKTLIIVAPSDSVPAKHLKQIDQFLARGGNLFIAMNRVEGNFQNLQGTAVNTGIESWLARKGIIVESNFVIDATCASVGVQQQSGFFNFTSQIQFPFLPIINKFANHPATKGLESVILQFASTILYTGDSSKVFTPLAMTSDKSGTLAPPVYFDVMKQWTKADFPLKNLTVAALISGKLAGDGNAKLIVITDGNFVVNGQGQKTQRLQEDNVNFMVNSIDYLSDDTGLIELRTKGITSRPIDQMEDGKKKFLKTLNFSLPLLLIIAYGIYRSQRNRMKRIKRMEEGYV